MPLSMRTAGLVVAILVALASTPSAASDFAERMAAWNAGPVRGARERHVVQAAYQEPVPDSPATGAPAATANVPVQQARPAQQVTAAPRSQWQQMAYGNGYAYGPHTGMPMHGGCDTCGVGDACGPTGCDMCCGKPLWWAHFDVLLWWREGRDLPPLVTTDPTSEDSTTAGILPDATILLGDDRETSDMAAGGRFDVGFWMDPHECWGIGNRFFGLGQDSTKFHVDSLDNPVLAIPFFDFDLGDNNALLVAYPGLLTGEIDVDANSSVIGNDVYARFLLCRDCNSRLDFVTGYHFSRINDNLRIASSRTVTEVGGNIPLGTVTDVLDQFDVRNAFHGAILGLMHECDCYCWTWTALGRISIGSMHERVTIDGSTRIAVPDEDPTVTAGGLFTGEENIGEFSRSEFTAVSELGLTLAYKWGPCTRLSVGYTFIYWNDVLRPGDQIDPRVGEDESGNTHPRFSFNHGDYWVQGINLGLVREF